MNKYIEMLDKIIKNETEKQSFIVHSFYGDETNKEFFYRVDMNFENYCSIDNSLKSIFNNTIPDLCLIDTIGFDCTKNEIDYVRCSIGDEDDPETEEFDMEKIILDSIEPDELDLYHYKCKIIIDIGIWNLKKRRIDSHDRYVDRHGGKYIGRINIVKRKVNDKRTKILLIDRGSFDVSVKKANSKEAYTKEFHHLYEALDYYYSIEQE